MIDVNVCDLRGAALDWAVANATKAWESAHALFPTMTLDPTFCGVEPRPYPRGEFGSMLMTCVLVPSNPFRQDPQPFCPSTDWSQGGPLIAKHEISLHCPQSTDDVWAAWIVQSGGEFCCGGWTPLIAACRSIVASKLGKTVQVPAELMEQ